MSDKIDEIRARLRKAQDELVAEVTSEMKSVDDAISEAEKDKRTAAVYARSVEVQTSKELEHLGDRRRELDYIMNGVAPAEPPVRQSVLPQAPEPKAEPVVKVETPEPPSEEPAEPNPPTTVNHTVVINEADNASEETAVAERPELSKKVVGFVVWVAVVILMLAFNFGEIFSDSWSAGVKFTLFLIISILAAISITTIISWMYNRRRSMRH